MDSLYLYFSWKRNKTSQFTTRQSITPLCNAPVEKGDFSVVMVGSVMGWKRLFKGGVV